MTTAERISLNTCGLQQSLPYRLCESFKTRWRFKITLPRVNSATLAGVKLDISSLSAVMKNNILLGRYEVQERRMAEKYLNSSDSVLEIGGAIGFIGLFCQLRLGIRQYTTVEANPGTVKLLLRNYQLNRIPPRALNLAVAGGTGTIDLNIGDDFWRNSVVKASGGAQTIAVPCETLAGIFLRLDYSPSVMIMDIEGAEQFVDFNAMPQSVKKVLIELHPSLIGDAKVRQIVGNLVQLGFQIECEESGTFFFLRK